MKTIQCAHPSHHHNGFLATCRLWTASGGVHALLVLEPTECSTSTQKELEKFLEFLNCYHLIIKFTTDYSREEINFLDVSVVKTNNHQQTRTNIYMLAPVTCITLKNSYLAVRLK